MQLLSPWVLVKLRLFKEHPRQRAPCRAQLIPAHIIRAMLKLVCWSANLENQTRIMGPRWQFQTPGKIFQTSCPQILDLIFLLLERRPFVLMGSRVPKKLRLSLQTMLRQHQALMVLWNQQIQMIRQFNGYSMLYPNVGVIRNPVKQEITLEFCRNQKRDICILSEAHINHEQIHQIRNN